MDVVRRLFLAATLGSVMVEVIGAPAARKLDAMVASSSAQHLQAFMAARGLSAANITIPQLVETALLFFSEVGAANLGPEQHSDILLYQWGVFNWGKGEHFEFDITRQFIELGSSGDDGMSQLRLTAYYAPTPVLRKIRVANKWCESKRGASDFRAYILASEAYAAVKTLRPASVKIEWFKV